MARDAGSFRRGGHKYKPEPTILVLCEDTKSSKNYLEDARLHFRIQVSVEISHCGNTDPLGIVREAVYRARKYDRIYCAIDRDRHPSFDAALSLAAGWANVDVIASHPCFEFWLLLHFGYTRHPYAEEGDRSPADVLVRDLRRKEGLTDYEKGRKTTPFKALLGERFALARRLAPRILAEALASNEPNPSTELHLLIDKFEGLSNPTPAA
jgi:hypothetical protein